MIKTKVGGSWGIRGAGLAAMVIASASGGAALAAPDISDVWWARSYPAAIRPMDGKPLPLTAEGRARFDKARADLKRDKTIDTGKYLCTPQGMPRAMATAYPIQIVETPQQVTILLEENRVPRIVKMNQKHADTETWDPSYMGESVGRWEGNTLVVDTTNFNGKSFIDGTGLPHSDQLHVVERISLAPGGKRLIDLITVEDPVMFSRPWRFQMTYERRPDIILRNDWVCGEAHRNISSVKQIAARTP